MTFLLLLVYPLLWMGRVIDGFLRRDPLRLHDGDAASFWIVRSNPPDRLTYFSEASSAEGHGDGGQGVVLGRLFASTARFLANRRLAPESTFSKAARDESIPDEIYTLW